MLVDALTWLAATLFYVLGAYVGAVSGLVYGGFFAASNVFRGAVAVPFALWDEIAAVYGEAEGAPPPLGRGDGSGAQPPQRPALRKKKLAEARDDQAVAGAPAGASYGHGVGGGDRGLLG